MYDPTPWDAVCAWAESGIPFLTGHPDGPPVIPPGTAAVRARAYTSWLRDASNGLIDVDGARLLGERAAYTGARRAGTVSVGGACRLLPTADGWAAVSCARPDDPSLLGALVGQDLGDDPWPDLTVWLASHTGEELAERAGLLGIAGGPVRTMTAEPLVPGPPRSVDGLLVVDFSALWAGPLCAHLLGLAGARVVKVETPSRPDGARFGNTGFYRLLHAGHESVSFDPSDPDQRAALADLVSAADIVIEASRPRALAGFGLSAEEFVATGTTWISITAYGRNVNRVGFGDDVAAGAGLIAWPRKDSTTPVFVGDAIADPLTGITAAALAMSAPPAGAGMLWDVSMADAVAATLPSEPTPPTEVVGDGTDWYVDTPSGRIDLSAPRPRDISGVARDSGADTEAVLAEIRGSR